MRPWTDSYQTCTVDVFHHASPIHVSKMLKCKKRTPPKNKKQTKTETEKKKGKTQKLWCHCFCTLYLKFTGLKQWSINTANKALRTWVYIKCKYQYRSQSLIQQVQIDIIALSPQVHLVILCLSVFCLFVCQLRLSFHQTWHVLGAGAMQW